MYRVVQLSFDTAVRFHDDGRMQLVRSSESCEKHRDKIWHVHMNLNPEERDKLVEAIRVGRKFFGGTVA